VAELCAEVVGRPAPPSLEVPLANLGFDSLACADLAAAVEDRFGVPITDGDVAEIRTVGDVARRVERGTATGPRIPPGLGRSQPVGKTLAGWTFRLYTRLRVEGTEHVPPTGAVIIAPNHRSMLDIPVLVVGCPRPVYFMAKQELFKNAPLSRLWYEFGGFSVRREISDIRAVDVALGLLRRGDAVAVYPEGRRSKTTEMLPFLHGPAWLALVLGAPIVPCGVIGTGREPGWDRRVGGFGRRHVRVAFGPPVEVEREPDPLARREKAALLTERLLEAVAGLMD
jgi:1-acyl-sn-glycerol-3-phosphate acyltransferase